MSYTAEDLYDLLPAVYRVRDAESGSVVKALLAVLAGQADVLDRDIARLYDNWFIETCDRWLVPYLGDLLRVKGLSSTVSSRARLPVISPRFTGRAYVANTLAYRRRKGTLAVLEQLAHDVTGWPAKALEFFKLLATTQHLNHLRPENAGAPDLRDTVGLELLGGPFDRVAHTVEVRRIEPRPSAYGRPKGPGRGRYNIPNLALFVWRLASYPIGISLRNEPSGLAPPRISAARLATTSAEAGYTFSPLGIDAPLFNSPRTEADISHLAEEADVPSALRRRALRDELEIRRQAIVDQSAHIPVFFTNHRPVLRVFVPRANDPAYEVKPERILICDLSQWGRPAASKSYEQSDGGASVSLPIEVAVDPQLGRLTLAEGITAVGGPVQVAFAYGFSGDMGGGPYDRRDGAAIWLEGGEITWQIGVTKDQPTLDAVADPTQLVSTLRDAVAAWNAHVTTAPEAFGVIAVMDSATYTEDLTGAFAIDVPSTSRLVLVAAGWPGRMVSSSPLIVERLTGSVAADELNRPHLDGNVSIRGTASATSLELGSFLLQGLMVEGRLSVLTGNLGTLRVIDCAVVPSEGGIVVNASADPSQQNDRLRIEIDRSICGPISLADAVPSLQIRDGIVDAVGGDPAISAPGAHLDLDRVTVFGATETQRLDASNVIFQTRVVTERLQVGCVRFSYVPEHSLTRVPRRYRCQPDLALAGKTNPAELARIRAELVPAFTSAVYGHPAYGQLGSACAEEIRTGAEDSSEMGAFSSLMQPQREANLYASLDEYLRTGLQAGVFYVT